ncbi:type II secretion system F family protein [Ideonella azotifigens]|nr:type II secretion system F family protein [Ideonella azotifigens]MCD2345012.1 type II secretion system F family protein [Ideonella azotifigens]
MDFEARLFDPASRAVELRRLQADDEPAARALLSATGHTVLELRTLRGRRQAAAGGKRKEDLALWCRELRALLQAGMSVVEALDALAAAAGPASMHEALLARLREGKSLSTAMQQVGGFPALLVASVRASERTSDLTHALDAFLRFDDMVGGLRRKVISAALYPAVVVGLGSLIAVFLLLVVIPRFAKLYSEAGAGVSTATRGLLAFSALLSAQPWLAPVGLALLFTGVLWALSGTRPAQLLAWLLRVWPWLAVQAGHFERARLFEALALLVHGGYSLHEALGVCLTLAQAPEMHARLTQARLRIEQGAAASVSFDSVGLTDPVTERLIRAGERGGEFDRVLRAIAERHRQTFETFIERATRIVEPVLLLGVALMVGSMVVLLYMPIFDIAGSVR